MPAPPSAGFWALSQVYGPRAPGPAWPGALGSLARASIRVLLGPLAQCSASGPRASLSLESVAVLGGPVAPPAASRPPGAGAPGAVPCPGPGGLSHSSAPVGRRPSVPRLAASCFVFLSLFLRSSLRFPPPFCGATPAPPHHPPRLSCLFPPLLPLARSFPRFAFSLCCFLWLSSLVPLRFLGPGPPGPPGLSGPGALRPSEQLALTDVESVRGPRPR